METPIDVPLTPTQIDMLLTGTDPDRLDDARRVLRAARAWARARDLIEASRGPAPVPRHGRRRSDKSHNVAQMLNET